jgi:Leucine-rich repeat (LRR) protein
LKSFTLPALSALTSFLVSGATALTSLTASGQQALQTASFENLSSLGTLDVSNSVGLSGTLTGLTSTALPLLTTLYVHGTNLSSLSDRIRRADDD